MHRFALLQMSCVLALGSSVSLAQTRLFVAPEGQQAAVATTGDITVHMSPGTTQTFVVWLQDGGSGQQLNYYQTIIRWLGAPLAGATGSVMYVNDGLGNGNSVLIDTTRPDWVFAGANSNMPVYNETAPGVLPSGAHGFGAIGSLVDLNAGTGTAGLNYLLEFDLVATPDACGQHRFDIVPSGLAPSGGTSLGQPGGTTPYAVTEFQSLIVDLTPANDQCASATPAHDGMNPVDSRCTTTDGNAHPGSACDNAGQDQLHNDQWFSYTATCTGELVVDTCGSANFDTRIALYDGSATCPPTSTDLLACNDDGVGCAGFTSSVETTVLTGDDLLIRVGGFDANTQGTGQLSIFCVGVCEPGSEVPNSPAAIAICGDPGACNQVSCDLALGCVVEPLSAGAPCSDGNVCTLTDACDGNGSCVGANPNPCNDFSPCTADSCDPAAGGNGCVNTPVAGQACSTDADCQAATPTATCNTLLGLCECQSCNSANCGLTDRLCLELRNAGGAIQGPCIAEDTECGAAPDGLLHCIDTDSNPLNGGACLDQACYGNADVITVDVELAPTTAPACGTQLFLAWDTATLDLVDVDLDPDGEMDWPLVLTNSVNAMAGTLDVVMGIPIGTSCNAANGATAGGTIARLSFLATQSCKSGGVWFRTHNPPTGIGGATGQLAITGCDGDLLPSAADPIQIQDAPLWSCPASTGGNADCGGLTRAVTVGSPSVTDDCDEITASAENLCSVQHFVPCTGDLDCGYDPSAMCAGDAACDGTPGSCVLNAVTDGFICPGNVPCVGFCREDVCTDGYCSASATPLVNPSQLLAGGDLVVTPGRYLVECSYTNGCGLTSDCIYDVVNTGLNSAVIDVELSPTLTTGGLGDPIERCIEFGLNICGAAGDPVFVSVPVAFGFPDHIPGHGTAVTSLPAGNWDCLTARDPAHSLMSSCWIECTADNFLYAEFKGSPATHETCHWLIQGNVDGDLNIDVIDYSLVAAALFTLAPNGHSTPCGAGDIDADFNGDGLVTLEDLSFVVVNFDVASKNPCAPLCESGGDGDPPPPPPGPRSSITVGELVARGHGAAADAADINGDGVIDAADIRATVESITDEPQLVDRLQKHLRRIERGQRPTKRHLRDRSE